MIKRIKWRKVEKRHLYNKNEENYIPSFWLTSFKDIERVNRQTIATVPLLLLLLLLLLFLFPFFPYLISRLLPFITQISFPILND